ncbi:hypothetical protein PG996_002024 [Apiospora saccharicola]|uniref:Uncharacterized protein n=1 Tax=Apiospora saccharicola TaxID=335842 RepID=A0ABR1WIF7_9PEZI
MEASTISKDTLVPDVPEIPPPPPQVRELVLDDRYADPPMQIPEPGPTELEAENRAVIRVAIWRAEVNAAAAASSLEETPNCACSFLTYRDPPTRWCPNCSTPFEGLEYRQFEAGRGLTRQESGRNSIANVWPVQTPLEGTHGHRHRQPPRGTSHVFSINEFAILGRKLVHRTKLDRVFSSSSKRERKPYAKLEYGDMPGSVAELHPVNDPPGNPSVLIGPNAPFYDPLLEYCMQRPPPGKLGDSVPKTEMYRSLRDNPGLYMKDRPSVSSLLDEWSSSDGDDKRNGKPKLTLDATTARLRRAQLLLLKTSGAPATYPGPVLVQTTPTQDTTNIPGT